MRHSPIIIFFLVLCPSSFALSQDAPRPAREAPAHFRLPDGFKATLFAGEPDVVQPIAMCFDDRGRLWVAECLSYPKWEKDPTKGKDRITIFEDTKGVGSFDKRTVFANNISNISGLQYGFGGVWVCSTPNLLFIPIKDDKPAGPPQVVLDGWDLTARHNVFNSLTWGPDGWLYGCNGILSNSLIGPPGTVNAKRIKMNCGVWRYHPTRKTFEVFAHGTTNPWGLDFDEHGQMFITNCVIGHLWHIVPGGRYERMFGQDLNPHSYGLLKQAADHIHWGGGSWTSSRAPLNPSAPGKGDGGEGADKYKVHSEAGGGHAHSGCMIYLGDNWPDRYRNGVFMCNIHGNRINHDILERKGSTYVARHGKDFMDANDPWFRGICLTYGPDGGVYVADWCDTGECHNYEVAHNTSGRIYKITYGKAKPWKGDLAKLSDLELVNLHSHSNHWHVRHARRLLQERAETGKVNPIAVVSLHDKLRNPGLIHRDLYALWALHAIKEIDENGLLKLFKHHDEAIRAWAVRLALEEKKVSKQLWHGLMELVRRDPSALVRLHLASAIQQIGNPTLHDIATALLMNRHEDAEDPFLPLMYWYAIEPLPGKTESHSWPFEITRMGIPLVRQNMTRGLIQRNNAVGEILAICLAEGVNPIVHRDVLRGLEEGYAGRRNISMPSEWKIVYPHLVESPLPEVRERAIALAVQFGDKRALDMLRRTALDGKAPQPTRLNALRHLVFNQGDDLPPLLQNLLTDKAMRGPAIKGLAAFDDAKTPGLILKQYSGLSDEEKADAVHTLASRPKYALALLDAIEAKTVARGDLSPFTVRQIQALKDAKLNSRLSEVWGTLRDPSKDRAATIGKWKKALTKEIMDGARPASGRALYVKNCAACHKLFDDGGAIGPNLTGSQRFNLDYVLENMIDPSAVVPREYQVTIFTTTGGRVLTGIIKEETDRAVTVQTQNEVVILPRDEIDTRVQSRLSMMPEGVLDNMTIEQVRDLVAYLASPAQVPLGK